MKRLFIFSLLCLGTMAFAQKKEYDPRMMGCYKGSEANQQFDGISKYWVSCRLDQGKNVLLFVAITKVARFSKTPIMEF